MPQELANILTSHLIHHYPTVSQDAIHSFVQDYVLQFDSPPTTQELIEMEDSFIIHLTIVDDTERIKVKPQEAPAPVPMQVLQPLDRSARADRSVYLIGEIEASFADSNKFKLLCNTIYKGTKSFINDCRNPLYSFIPLKLEDVESKQEIFYQIVALCSEYGLVVDVKDKGMLIKFIRSDDSYIDSLRDLLQAFVLHKDESVLPKQAEPRQAHSAIDPNRSERVEAYLEAKRLRAIVGPPVPDPLTFEANGSNWQAPPPASTAGVPHRYTDYPEAPPEDGNRRIEERLKYRVEEAPPRAEGTQQLSHKQQIEEYRNRCKWNNHAMVEARDNFMTWGQLSDKIDVEDREVLGRQCLEFTNEFRKQQGKSPLKWEPLMFDIAFVHSQNMGDKKVAFGHDGFNLRSRKMPFAKHSTGENVAYVGGCPKHEIAKVGSGYSDHRGRLDQLAGPQEEPAGQLERLHDCRVQERSGSLVLHSAVRHEEVSLGSTAD